MKATVFLAGIALAALLLALPASAQCSVTTTFAHNNGQSGNMFDIVSQHPNGVFITRFDLNIDPGTYTIEVYVVSGGGSHVGNQTNPSAWTLIDTFTNVTSAATSTAAPGVPTPLPPLTSPVPIGTGQTQGFYLTVSNGTGFNYTNGTAVGNVAGADANIQVLEGVGNAYPFSTVFQPRIWNGNVHYTYPGQVQGWQVNNTVISLDVDGVQALTCSPAIVQQALYACTPVVPVTGAVNVSSTQAGMPWDIAVNGAPVVPLGGGGLALGPDSVNLDLSAPLVWMSTGTTTPGVMILPPGGPFSLQIPYSVSQPGIVSGQAYAADPSSPTGVRLSQASELSVSLQVPVVSFPGPVGDDTSLTVDVTAAPTCWCSGGVPFFGTTFTQISVISNGRVMAGPNGDIDLSPTVAEALADNAFVGFWTDLAPNSGGSITLSGTGNGVRIDYQGVPYYAQTTTANTFGMQFDCGSGMITVDGLAGIVANPASTGTGDNQFLGLSPGNLLGATDPGPVTFSAGGSGAGGPTDMIYDFYDYTAGGGLAASLVPGTLSQILFAPSGTSYAWAGM